MRFTSTIALCLLLGSSWAQKKIIVHNRTILLINNNIVILCHNDGITLYNYDSTSISLRFGDTKNSYPRSFLSSLPSMEYKRLYSNKGKKLCVHIGYDMGRGREITIKFSFKRPPRKHRGRSFFMKVFCLSQLLSRPCTV